MGLFSRKPKVEKEERKGEQKEEQELIGEVTHYFGGIDVAIVKFNRTVKVGEKLHFKGATTDFEEVIVSMQYNHQDIPEAKKGQEVGIKVGEKVREADKAYAAQ